MDSKKFFRTSLILLLTILICIAGLVAFVDPFFHFHAPIAFLEYPLNNQRYQNNGISRNFDYDAIITGTSMTENFKVSQLNELFGVNAVKLSYSGASLKEIESSLEIALKSHPDTKMVVRCLDYYKLTEDKDKMEYDSYPDYLYDDILINDIRYLLDKTSLKASLNVLLYTFQGNETTDFDTYSSWSDRFEYGYAAVMKKYNRSENCAESQKEYSDYYKKITTETINQNVVSIIEQFPDTEFYLFFPPYGIAAWDNLYRIGNLKIVFEAERLAIKQLLKYDNVHIYDFLECEDIVSDLNNYHDTSHYGEWINSFILESMAKGEYEITIYNVDEYCDKIENIYLNYDYDSVFETK